MLIKLSVENFKSFDGREELSMISSSKIRENKSHCLKIKNITLLKNAAVYGANASGKSNLVEVFAFIKTVLRYGLLPFSVRSFCRNRNEEKNKSRPSFFELQFTVGDVFYAYGFSAILSEMKITEEWLYELKQNGNFHPIFTREGNNPPKRVINFKNNDDKARFAVYANDFTGREYGSRLFLSEIGEGKKYEKDSGLSLFSKIYGWIKNNIIVISPDTPIITPDPDTYCSDTSLESISNLIKTFDTGISEIKTREITPEELEKMDPDGHIKKAMAQLTWNMQRTKMFQITQRGRDGFFNLRYLENGKIQISTLVLKHGKSDFSFEEESDGTRRLFDLIDMLITDRPDTLFVVDELERSLHPKLMEKFLQLFTEKHNEDRMQLIFATHENYIMDQNLFRRDEIWFVERNADNASSLYPLDRFKVRYDKKLSKAYLEGRYGAVPVFKEFSFKED